MTHDDLAEFESEWVEPITTNYHGFDIFQLPPPGQGLAALEMLNILEVCAPIHGVSLAELGPTSPDYWHFMVEAKKLAYSDLHAYNADPLFSDVPVEKLLAKSYAISNGLIPAEPTIERSPTPDGGWLFAFTPGISYTRKSATQRPTDRQWPCVVYGSPDKKPRVIQHGPLPEAKKTGCSGSDAPSD